MGEGRDPHEILTNDGMAAGQAEGRVKNERREKIKRASESLQRGRASR